MRKITAVFFLSLGVIAFLTISGDEVISNTSGGPAAHSGSPADGKTCRSCHSGPSETFIPGLITSDIPEEGYIPGETYNFTASISRNGHSKFGFQVSPQNNQGTLLGALIATSSQTKLVGTGGKYITQTSSGTNGANQKNWDFQWTAPAAGTGNVTFYGVFNVTNNNNSSSGDTIFTSTLMVSEHPFSSFSPNPSADNEIHIFPTFTTGFLNVSFESNSNRSASLELISMNGQLHRISNLELNLGKNLIPVDISDLPSGMYFVKVKVDDKEQIFKVVLGK
jgi:hypothetical protein